MIRDLLSRKMARSQTMRGVILGVSIAAGCIGSASAQSTDASPFVGLWCSGPLHHLDSGSIALAIPTVNDGVAFGTYAWRGSEPVQVSIEGSIAGGILKIAVDLTVSLDLAIKDGRLHGTLSNHRMGRRWDVTLTKREAC